MTRRLSALLLLVALLVTSSVVPGVALATGPGDDVSVLSANGRLLPPLPDELRSPSVHAEMLADQGAGAFAFEPGGPPTVLLGQDGRPKLADGAMRASGFDATTLGTLTAAGLPNGLHKEVFGFLPYWMLTDAALDDLNFALLSTVAYFSVNVNADGYLVKGSSGSPSAGWAGWTSSNMTQVLDRAHSRGVKVVLTVTMMAWDSASAARQERVLTSATRRTRLVNQIVDAVRRRGADGVNLDFEPLATSLRGEYVSLVKQLKSALKAAGAGDYLTVCVMAGAATWATGYDVDGLTASGAADALFVMGYDYHWSGSSRAGGVAPINSPYTLDVDGTMMDFLAETSGAKLIWGVPYYGRTWRTTRKTLNSPTLSGGSKAYTYVGHRRQASRYGRRWDDVGRVPWYRFWDGADGNWVQGYYDDPRSLGVKYDLVNARGLAGTGMWTLLMDQGRDELWQLLADKFVNDTAPPVGGISLLPPTTDGLSVRVRWNVTDHASGVDRYNLQARALGGAWQTWLRGTTQTSAWFTGEADTRYEFRVQAIDNKGNAQEWVTVPQKPSEVRAEAFARVLTATLNVRSGPGTGYGVVAQALRDDPVYVIEGPVAASGMEWFRVQYGFGEWPSSDYPRIGWIAAASDGEDYLAPARAPTITLLSPFVRDLSASSPFSPNGDGNRDVASIGFTLTDAASSVRLEIVEANGDVVQTRDLGARSAGSHVTSWNGGTSSGGTAREGTYLPRIVAVESGEAHYGPARGVSDQLLETFGIRLDVTRPGVRSHAPAAAAELVAATEQVVIDFSERMVDVGAENLYLQDSAGELLVASNERARAGRGVVITPVDPLPVGSAVTVVVSNRPTDAAGNPVRPRSWQFSTALGSAYDPLRGMTMRAGTHTAYLIGAAGDVSSPTTVELDSPSGASVGHRAQLPNLPGRWLHVEDGAFAGRWLRESPSAYLPGETERAAYDRSTRIVMLAGPHTGYRFDAAGDVVARLRVEPDGRTTPRISGRRTVNGRAYLHVLSGPWAGYLVRESRRAFVPGTIERIGFPGALRVTLQAGTHTGYRFASDGRVRDRVTATQARASVATATAWAVINGVSHYRISDGTWGGTWVPDTTAIRLKP